MDDDLARLLGFYRQLIPRWAEFAHKKAKLRLPRVEAETFGKLLDEAKEAFRSQPVVLELRPPVCVIGDIHGHLLDLLRILSLHDVSQTTYLLVGDIVDRGEFSTESLMLVLLLKLRFPDTFHLIRGNHEAMVPIIDHGAFFTEMRILWPGCDFEARLSACFGEIPLAACIANYAFVVHGGIGAETTVEEIRFVRRPVLDFASHTVEQVLWSDPTEVAPEYEGSDRGLGVLFGIDAVRRFLSYAGYTVLIRGHQAISGGVETSLGARCVTVFSASNYMRDGETKCGIVHVDDGLYEREVLDVLPWIARGDAVFGSAPRVPAISLLSATAPISSGPPSAPTRARQPVLAHKLQRVTSNRLPPVVEAEVKQPPQRTVMTGRLPPGLPRPPVRSRAPSPIRQPVPLGAMSARK